MEKFLLANQRKHSFTIEGRVQTKLVKGEFECKYPSVIDGLQINTNSSRLLENAYTDALANEAFNMAYKIAFTDVLLTKRPEWFNFAILDDMEVINKVYAEIMNFIDTFRQGNGEEEHREISNNSTDEEIMEGK